MSLLLHELKSKVLYLTFNRPERANSLNPALLAELWRELYDAQQNPDVKIIVLSGSGNKDFTTGIDVSSVSSFSTEGKTNLGLVAGDIATLLFSGKPSIVAINGRAMGMGIVFAAAADYRLMVDSCEWNMPEVTVGIFPGASCIAIMSRVCGLAWTRRILMTGEILNPMQAIEAHIADEISSSSEMEERIKKITRVWKSYNQVNLKSIKLATIGMPDLNYLNGLLLEKDLSAWYEWQDPESALKNTFERYNLQFKINGDAQKLLKESERTNL